MNSHSLLVLVPCTKVVGIALRLQTLTAETLPYIAYVGYTANIAYVAYIAYIAYITQQ
jgi:hypothetical protein